MLACSSLAKKPALITHRAVTTRGGPAILAAVRWTVRCGAPQQGKDGGSLRVLKGIFRFLFGIFRAVVWTAGLLALAVFLFFYVAARPIPRTTLGQLLTALSPETDMLDAHSASFGLREGLVLHKVRLLPKGVVAPEWFTADELRLSGGFRPDRPPREWVDTVVAHRVNLAALPPRPPSASTGTNAATAIPSLAPMRFDLVDATLLGMRFQRLQGLFRQENGVIFIENAKIEWPRNRWPEDAEGSLRFDPASGLIEGRISGHLTPDRVYPLLRMLEANGALEIAHRFAFNSRPVDVEAHFRVAPAEPHYELRLSLVVTDATYGGVPVRRVSAILVADGTNDLERVRIDPLVCERPDGRLSGSLDIDLLASNVDFAAQADMPIEPLLRIIRVNLNPEKNGFVFDTPPRLTAAGRVPLDGNLDGIVLAGSLLAPTATVRSVKLQDLSCEFAIATNAYAVRNVRATAAGGEIRGTLHLVSLPGDGTQMTYRTSFQIEHLDLHTFAAQLGFTNIPSGTASATMSLASSLGAGHVRCLSGNGEVQVEKGELGRIPLFAGLTDYLARNVPGVDLMISQSEASLPFSITNGVLSSDHLLVEGNIFSIGGNGTYSFPNDQLDFCVRTSIFKQRTWLGRFWQIVTFPFSKLLLEFRVKGPPANPVWEYHGVLERIVDTVGSTIGGKKDAAP